MDLDFKEIQEAAKTGKKLDVKQDLAKILANSKVKYTFLDQLKTIPDKPTIILANHFVRPSLFRRSLFTTQESILTSAIISKSIEKLSTRPLTCTVKNDIITNIFFLSVKAHKAQLAAIDVYDFIGVFKNYPFGSVKKWTKALSDGKNILVYPEGTVSTAMKKSKAAFSQILATINKQNIDYQILPVAISSQGPNFILKQANIIKNSPNTNGIANQSVLEIAAMLPANLRGYYKLEVDLFIRKKTKARQLQEDDPKLSPLEPQAALAESVLK